MNLYREIRSVSAWSSGVMRVFMKKRFATTTAIITTSVISRITRMLTLLLPLKVILLAGSSRVPRYFPFIDQAHRMEWIVGLTVATFVCYALTLALNALSKRWSEAGSAEILQEANDRLVVSDQQEEARSYYSILCQNSAARIFIAIGLVVLLAMNVWLFLTLVTLIAAQFIVTSWILSGRDDSNPRPLRRVVQEGYGNYLSILSSVNFLIGFLVILAPFLTEEPEGNILIAILSIIVTKQILSNLVSMVKGTMTLVEAKHRINALVFREHQMERVERPLQKTLRDLFDKSARQALVEEALKGVGIEAKSIDVQWIDPVVRGINAFRIRVDGGSGKSFYQLKAFSPGYLQLAEYEDFLFKNISRQRLKAPEMIARFWEGPFQCRIYEYGNGTPMPIRKWPDHENALLEYYWSCKPPRGLVNAFISSRPLLHKRLGDELINRINIAIDSTEEAHVMREFQSRLPLLQGWIESLPLHIHNPDMNRLTTVIDDQSDGIWVMDWGRWTLEPIGAFLPRPTERDVLNAILDKVRSARSDIPPSLSGEDLLLASLCKQLETELVRERYKSALELVSQIIADSVFLDSPVADQLRIVPGSG